VSEPLNPDDGAAGGNRAADGLGEFELIGRFFTRPGRGPGSADSGRDGVLLGIGDDAALLRLPAATDLVAAVDTIVAGRHFLAACDPQAVGHRVLAVNLSDLAAMGATPAWATLALTLPRADRGWLAAFARGLFELADRHRVALVGGDTTSGPLTISLQLLGHVPRGQGLRRSGARAGDLLAVSGCLGDAGAGLALAQGRLLCADAAAAAELRGRFEYPTPRVEFGLRARDLASAAMDLSDGLVADLPKLAAASGLKAFADVERLPLSPAMRTLGLPTAAEDWALGAGDDYELLLAFAPENLARLEAAAAQSGVALTVIGELQAGSGVHWRRAGAPYVPRVCGYDHFR
jgi:thiamine-monophosphate kinase